MYFINKISDAIRFADGITTETVFCGIFLCYKFHALKRAFVLFAACGNVYARGLYRTMAKHIGKMGKVLFNRVKRAGKKVPQVMREHLALFHMRRIAEPFHVVAYVRPVYGSAALCAEYYAGVYMLPRCVFGKLFAKLIGNEHCAALTLQAYLRLPLFNGVGGYVAQFAYPYPCCAYGLHDEAQPFVAARVRCVDQPLILHRAQFPAFVYKGSPLHL